MGLPKYGRSGLKVWTVRTGKKKGKSDVLVGGGIEYSFDTPHRILTWGGQLLERNIVGGLMLARKYTWLDHV